MKVRLVRPARINVNAGEVVEASTAQACFLISVGAAVPVAEEQRPELKRETPERRKKTTKKG